MSLLTALPTTPANLMRNVAENQSVFRRKFLDGFGFKDQMQTLYGRDIVPLPRIRTGQFIRPGRTGVFTPNANTLTLSARQAQLKAVKGDVEFTEVEIETAWNTYFGQLQMLSGAAQQREYILQVPFENVLIDEILKKANHDYHLNAAFRGTYNPAGTTPASVDDGLLTKMAGQFNVDIPAANLLATATPTATNMIAITQAFVDVIAATAPQYLNEPLKMWMSPQVKRFYERNLLSANNVAFASYYNTFKQPVLFEQPNIEIVAEAGMSGSNRIFVTTGDNLKFCTDSDSINVRVLAQIRSWQIALDWKSTLDFCEGELIWSNTLA